MADISQSKSSIRTKADSTRKWFAWLMTMWISVPNWLSLWRRRTPRMGNLNKDRILQKQVKLRVSYRVARLIYPSSKKSQPHFRLLLNCTIRKTRCRNKSMRETRATSTRFKDLLVLVTASTIALRINGLRSSASAQDSCRSLTCSMFSWRNPWWISWKTPVTRKHSIRLTWNTTPYSRIASSRCTRVSTQSRISLVRIGSLSSTSTANC